MKSITEIRRENARALKQTLANQSNADFANKISRPATMISRYIGKNPTQAIGDDLARHIEFCFKKQANWLDTLHPIIGQEKQQDSQNKPGNGLDSIEELGNISYSYQKVSVINMAKVNALGTLETPPLLNNEINGYINHPTQDTEAYALKIVGESMHPTIRHGWYIVIEPNLEFYNDMLAIIKTTDGVKMLKEIAKKDDGYYTLTSVNSQERQTLHETELEYIQPIGGIIPPNKVLFE